MRGVNSKICLTILFYSVVMTASLLLGLFLFSKSLNFQNMPSKYEVLFFTDNDNLMRVVESGEVKISINSSISINELDSLYKEQFTRYLPISVFVICVFVFLTSFILWMILKTIYKNQFASISERIRCIQNDIAFEISGEPLENEYQGIINKFERYLSDYKRLNSYITHEQKNALSLLRAKLEMRGEKELLNNIDAISSRIDDILTISRSKENIVLSPVDATLVCAEACDEYKKIYPLIIFEFDDDDTNVILAKEIWLYRAVCNLIDNAIKYGNNQEIEVCISKKQGSVIITVSDKGIGIEAELTEYIFNDSFRISELKKDGYGIGLSLVRHVCDLCGGLYYVDSKVGVGSTFYLVFPERK